MSKQRDLQSRCRLSAYRGLADGSLGRLEPLTLPLVAVLLIVAPSIPSLSIAAPAPADLQRADLQRADLQRADPQRASDRSSEPLFEERLEVRLLEIDVLVESFLGRPIAGLTERDFRVYEDGEPREVVDVTGGPWSGGPGSDEAGPGEPGAATGAAAGDAPLPPSAHRSFVLAFDFESLWRPLLARAMPKVQRFVEANAGPSIHWAVVVLGHTPYALTDWTTDSAEVVEGLERALELRRGVGTSVWALGSFAEAAVSRELALAARRPDEGGGDGERPIPGATLEDLLVRAGRVGASIGSMTTADSLARLLESLQAPGKEATIVLHYASNLNQAASGLSGEAMLASARIKRHWERAARLANTAGVRIHTTDLRGLNFHRLISPPSTPTSALSESGGPPLAGMTSFDVEEGAMFAAVRTGGRDTQSNAWAAGLERALVDARNHYRVTIRLPHPVDGRKHRLEVELRDRPGAHLRYRRAYVDLSPQQLLERQLAGSGNVPRAGADFPLELELDVDAVGGGVTGRAALSVPVTRLGLVEQRDGSRLGAVVIYLAVYGADGGRVELRQAERAVVMPAAAFDEDGGDRSAEASALEEVFDLELPAGRWTVTAAAYDRVERTSSVTTRHVDSPAPPTPGSD